MKKIKVLFIEQNTDGTIGGSHYCMLYLAKYLNKEIYEPIAMFYEDNPLVVEFKKVCETFIFNKWKTLVLQKNDFVRKCVSLFFIFANIIKCLIFLRSNSVHIVHLNNTVAVGYDTWLISSKILRIPCVTHERNYMMFDNLSLPFFNYLSKKYDKVIAVSNVIRNNLIRQGFDKGQVVTVYDGIDKEKFKSRVGIDKKTFLKINGMPEQTYLIGMIGNIREWKGQELLIDALTLVNKQLRNFICLLVGDVAKDNNEDKLFMERLLHKCKENFLENNVILTGYRSDIPDIINALDIQISVSIKPDPFPHVILEGMALGRVVVATDLGGARESIADGLTGFLIDHHNPQELADKILFILRNDFLRKEMSQNAVERVGLFSMQATIEGVEKIYKVLRPV